MTSYEEGTPPGKEVLKPGTTLLTCEPFVYSCYMSSSQVCDACLTIDEDGTLRRCKSCQVVWYCNRTCQEKGWNDGHKFECKGMKLHYQTLCESPSKRLIRGARILLRVFMKLQSGIDYFDELEIGGTKVKRRFSDLMSHSEKYRQERVRLESMWRTVEIVKLLLGPKSKIKIPEVMELTEIFGKVNTNAFAIGDGFYNVASGIYLGCSIFNHSCNPMAIRVYDGPTMHVRNIQGIPQSLSIDKVTVCYVNQLMPSNERRKVLKRDYYFDCDCEKCKTGLFDKEMRSIVCWNKRCNAMIDTEEMKNPCSACGNRMKDDEISKVLEAEKHANDMFDGDGFDLIQVEECIQKMKKFNFSESHWLMLKLFNEAFFKGAEKDPNWERVTMEKEKLFQYGSKYHSGIKCYLHRYDKELLRSSFDLGWFALLLRRLDDAEKYISEAKSIREVLYGKNLPFMQNRIAFVQDGIREMKMICETKHLSLA